MSRRLKLIQMQYKSRVGLGQVLLSTILSSIELPFKGYGRPLPLSVMSYSSLGCLSTRPGLQPSPPLRQLPEYFVLFSKCSCLGSSEFFLFLLSGPILKIKGMLNSYPQLKRRMNRMRTVARSRPGAFHTQGSGSRML